MYFLIIKENLSTIFSFKLLEKFKCVIYYVYVLDGYNPKSQTHRSMLLCLLMTSCDLSDQTKGWKTTRKIAVSLDLSVTIILSLYLFHVQARL